MYLLDTDHLTFHQRGEGRDYETLVGRIALVREQDIHVSVVTFHEQMLGWHNYLAKDHEPARLVQGYDRFDRLIGAFGYYQLRSFDVAAAEIYSELRRRRVRVGAMDLRIASIAIANGFTLLTRNSVDFERVPDLGFKNWTN